MPLTIEDVYRRLSFLLLRAPRELLRAEAQTFRLTQDILGTVGLDVATNPVTGVGMTQGKNDNLEACIFLSRHVEGFSRAVQNYLELGDFSITQLTTGRIRLNSRPARGGDSLGQGQSGGESGTFGCLVEDAARNPLLLTCNHVLSDPNNGRVGDPVWQPSDSDGGSASDQIGTLHDFAPITFGGLTANYVDAALVRPISQSYVVGGLRRIGQINGTSLALSYKTPVEKVGWKTKHTKGTFLYKCTFQQDFSGNRTALFEDQLGIVGVSGDFSSDGDSGSLVVNDNQEAVGLVFAEATDISMTFANPIWRVFNHFGITPL